MKNCFLILILLLASCGISEIGGNVDQSDDNFWKGPSVGGNTSGSDLKRTCYVTAMDYKDGYDWRKDLDRGVVKCSLVVFADGRPVMKIAVADRYETSSDPDMHRVVNGHLYTDFSTLDETVVKKDGKDIFRYPGREQIVGFCVQDEGVYTLGVSRSGNGFSCRLNGEVLLERDSGYPFHHLQVVEGKACFGFCETVLSGEKHLERYWWAENGDVSQIAVREDVVKVWDIASHEGKLCWIGSLVGVPYPVLVTDDKMETIDMPSDAKMLSFSLKTSGQNVYVEGMYSIGDQSYGSLWCGSDCLMTTDAGGSLAASTVEEEGICCVVNPSVGSNSGYVYHCGEIMSLPEGYVCMGDGATSAINGMFNVGLSSLNEDRPVLWRDGLLDTLNVNGFIATVSH